MFTAGDVKLLVWGCCLRLTVGICLWAARIPLQHPQLQPGPVEPDLCFIEEFSKEAQQGLGVRGPGRPGVSRDAEGLWALPEGSAVLGHCQHHVRLLLPLPPGSLWSAQTCVECFSSVPCSGSQQTLVFGSVAPASLCLSSFNCKSCQIL